MIHKAQPRYGFRDGKPTELPICYHCGQNIKRVPGGQGSTWVHDDGYVMGKGTVLSVPDQIRSAVAVVKQIADELYPQTDGSGGGPWPEEYGEHMPPADAYDHLEQSLAEVELCLYDLLWAVEKLNREEPI